MRRVTVAVLTGRPDATVSTMRTGPAVVIGGSVTAVVLAAVALFAVLTGGDSGWHRGGSVIVEKETGTRLVLVGGVLHPALNDASARLVVGSSDRPIAVVSHAALASIRRGATVGIAGAPDALPAAGAIDRGAWTVCSRSTLEGAVIFAGVRPPDERPLGSAALLVSVGAGHDYLLWQAKRRQIVHPERVFTAMGWGDPVATRMDSDVLNALPPGADVSTESLPPRSLRLARSDGAACVEISAQGIAAGVWIGATVAASARVVVPAGHGVLVRSSDVSVPCLLTDAGSCFPIADDASLASLGYGAATPVVMPASVVSLLAHGPTLSRTAALASIEG